MAAVWESHNTSAWASTSTVTITKPTGLAVGNLLLAIITCRNPGGQTVSLPTNWTSIYNVTPANGNTVQRAMYKVADSGDVALSNFSFTIASGPSDATGGLARISGYGNINASSTATALNTTTSPLTTGTVTPDRTNCLFILTAGGGQSGGASTPALSGYVLTTDDPTWTEQFEITQANAYTFAVATATRTAETATGTASITLSTAPASGDYVIGMIAIAPSLSVTSTPAAISNFFETFNPLSPAMNKFVVNTPTTTETTKTLWTAESKPSTSWTNETT